MKMPYNFFDYKKIAPLKARQSPGVAARLSSPLRGRPVALRPQLSLSLPLSIALCNIGKILFDITLFLLSDYSTRKTIILYIFPKFHQILLFL